MPRLAVFPAAAHVCRDVDTTALEDRRYIWTEPRDLGDVEAAVAVQHRWIGAVLLQILTVRDEQRHARAVLRGGEDALGRVERRIERELRRFERRARAAGQVEAEHRRGIQRRREGVEDFRPV